MSAVLRWLAVAIATGMLSGCISKQFVPPIAPAPPMDAGWSSRKVSKEELTRLAQNHVDLDYRSSIEILSRLNARDRDYIEDDIKRGRSLRVPNDFRYYKNWTPLPRRIPEVDTIPKFVLVVKSYPFLGWYEKGQLVEDSYVCIGKKGEWTKAGLYKVSKKDENHVSASYRNAYDQPALMPWALHIYGHVWIHAGDIEGPNCSHGCINLPVKPAQKLFSWTDAQTTVLVIDTLKDLQKTLPKRPIKSAPGKTPPPKPAPAKDKTTPVKPTPAKATPGKAA